MKKENWLLVIIAIFLLFATKLSCDKNRIEQNSPVNQVEEIPEEFPVLAQNKVATNPLVQDHSKVVEITHKMDTKDFQEVSEEESNRDKPFGKPQV